MADTPRKKVIFSGVQPSGIPTIGNYLGAFKNWNALQEEYNCLYCVVDLHSITVRQEPAELRRATRNMAALLMACGLDPQRNILYVQSHVAAHAELAWLLNCYTYMGELSRMTQYKDKAAKHSENINAGLFAYPVLMAADILLFNADLVPIGDDQRQHLELTRDVAQRFNGVYGNVFTVPEAFYGKVGARIMSLSDPAAKMSKSDEGGGSITLLDAPDVVMRKFKRAVTDSSSEIRYDIENKPGVSSLLTIYAATLGISMDAAVAEFEGKNYGYLKTTVAEAVIENITRPIGDKYNELISKPDHIDEIIRANAEKAAALAARTMSKVKKKIGLLL